MLTTMLPSCLLLLSIVGTLLNHETNAQSVDGCYTNGNYYELSETWNSEVGECVQYKCGSRGIEAKRCINFLDAMSPDKFQELLDVLDTTNCTFEGAVNTKPYPECCNRIMCLHEFDPFFDTTSTAARTTETKPDVLKV